MNDSSSRVWVWAGGPLVRGGIAYSNREYASRVDLPLAFTVMPRPIAAIWCPSREGSMYPPPRVIVASLCRVPRLRVCTDTAYGGAANTAIFHPTHCAEEGQGSSIRVSPRTTTTA